MLYVRLRTFFAANPARLLPPLTPLYYCSSLEKCIFSQSPASTPFKNFMIEKLSAFFPLSLFQLTHLSSYFVQYLFRPLQVWIHFHSAGCVWKKYGAVLQMDITCRIIKRREIATLATTNEWIVVMLGDFYLEIHQQRRQTTKTHGIYIHIENWNALRLQNVLAFAFRWVA